MIKAGLLGNQAPLGVWEKLIFKEVIWYKTKLERIYNPVIKNEMLMSSIANPMEQVRLITIDDKTTFILIFKAVLLGNQAPLGSERCCTEASAVVEKLIFKEVIWYKTKLERIYNPVIKNEMLMSSIANPMEQVRLITIDDKTTFILIFKAVLLGNQAPLGSERCCTEASAVGEKLIFKEVIWHKSAFVG
ncbi:hypothetical protein HNS38_16855 [Lentimicrobium sp. L6]|uniref:hypothetical protein n=1 Tax=Lentimicrobium sp. L6 TaxID=2735916 RepID=UPI0015541A22|nr:hypothetical protein [Lentimicrobium sp. L6]NPD86445.1 hypothetical protein [Lentimicrobium sp. L6]